MHMYRTQCMRQRQDRIHIKGMKKLSKDTKDWKERLFSSSLKKNQKNQTTQNEKAFSYTFHDVFNHTRFVLSSVCRQPPMTGMCRGYIPSFHYNVTESGCRQFIFGGCGGNQNRFESEEECMSFCAP